MNPNPMPAPPPAPPQRSGSSGAIVAIVIFGLFGACAVFGVVAAIAIPNFIKFGSRSKQSECKSNLKALYTGQRVWFMEKDDYSESFTEFGFAPESKRRYSYFMGPGAEVKADLVGSQVVPQAAVGPLAGGDPPGVYEDCPADCFFVAACAGNVDTDETIDVWSISSAERKKDGKVIAPGEVFHDVDDTRD